MSLPLKIIIFCQFLNVVLGVGVPLLSKKPFHFARFDGMCRGKKVPTRVNHIIAKQEGNMIYLNSTYYITEDLDGDFQVTAIVYRCRSKESLDTCEEFIKTSPDSYCATINPKVPALSLFYIDYTPKLVCPLKKGTYRAYNNKLDFTPFLALPLGDYYWKSESQITDPKSKRLIGCCFIDGYQNYN